MVESFSHRRKLARADLHIRDVKAMLEGWDKGGYRICEETDSEGRLVVSAQLLKPLPDQLELAIGDALHCQRASLDHLIYALSRAYTKRALTDKEEKQIAFPIGDDVAITPTNSRIAFIDPDARTLVCAVAPDPARKKLHHDPLWLLNKAENRDKHRTVPVAATAAYISLLIRTKPGVDIDHAPVKLEFGTDPVPVRKFSDPDSYDHVGVAVDVRFDEGSELAGRPVRRILPDLSDYIRNAVFQPLEAFL